MQIVIYFPCQEFEEMKICCVNYKSVKDLLNLIKRRLNRIIKENTDSDPAFWMNTGKLQTKADIRVFDCGDIKLNIRDFITINNDRKLCLNNYFKLFELKKWFEYHHTLDVVRSVEYSGVYGI